MDVMAGKFPEGMNQLPHHQHFPDIVPSEEELNGGEVAEEGFDVAIVEDALQAETIGDGGVNRARGSAARFPFQNDALHLEHIFFEDVEAVAGRIRTGVFRVEEG